MQEKIPKFEKIVPFQRSQHIFKLKLLHHQILQSLISPIISPHNILSKILILNMFLIIFLNFLMEWMLLQPRTHPNNIQILASNKYQMRILLKNTGYLIPPQHIPLFPIIPFLIIIFFTLHYHKLLEFILYCTLVYPF